MINIYLLIIYLFVFITKVLSGVCNSGVFFADGSIKQVLYRVSTNYKGPKVYNWRKCASKVPQNEYLPIRAGTLLKENTVFEVIKLHKNKLHKPKDANTYRSFRNLIFYVNVIKSTTFSMKITSHDNLIYFQFNDGNIYIIDPNKGKTCHKIFGYCRYTYAPDAGKLFVKSTVLRSYNLIHLKGLLWINHYKIQLFKNADIVYTPFIPWNTELPLICRQKDIEASKRLDDVRSLGIYLNFTYGRRVGLKKLYSCLLTKVFPRYLVSAIKIELKAINDYDIALLTLKGSLRIQHIFYRAIINRKNSQTCIENTCVQWNYITPTKTLTITQTPTHTDSLTLTHTHTSTISNTLTKTITKIKTLTKTLTLSNTLTHTLTKTKTLSNTLTHTLSKTKTVSNTLAHTLSKTKTVSNTLTYTLTNTLSNTLAHTLTNTLSNTLAHTLTNAMALSNTSAYAHIIAKNKIVPHSSPKKLNLSCIEVSKVATVDYDKVLAIKIRLNKKQVDMQDIKDCIHKYIDNANIEISIQDMGNAIVYTHTKHMISTILQHKPNKCYKSVSAICFNKSYISNKQNLNHSKIILLILSIVVLLVLLLLAKFCLSRRKVPKTRQNITMPICNTNDSKKTIDVEPNQTKKNIKLGPLNNLIEPGSDIFTDNKKYKAVKPGELVLDFQNKTDDFNVRPLPKLTKNEDYINLDTNYYQNKETKSNNSEKDNLQLDSSDIKSLILPDANILGTKYEESKYKVGDLDLNLDLGMIAGIKPANKNIKKNENKTDSAVEILNLRNKGTKLTDKGTKLTDKGTKEKETNNTSKDTDIKLDKNKPKDLLDELSINDHKNTKEEETNNTSKDIDIKLDKNKPKDLLDELSINDHNIKSIDIDEVLNISNKNNEADNNLANILDEL